MDGRRQDPFRKHPELRPVFILKDEPDQISYPFSGFGFLGGNIWLGPSARALTPNQIRILARVTLDQTDAVIAERISVHGVTVAPATVAHTVEKLRARFRAPTRESLLSKAIAANVMTIGPDDYGPRANFAVSEESIAMLSLTARGLPSSEIAARFGLQSGAAVSKRYNQVGDDVGFYGAALLVTAAVITHQLDPVTCEPVPPADL